MSLLMLYRPFPRTGVEPPPAPGATPRRLRRKPTEDEWLGRVSRGEDGRQEPWVGYR